MPGKDGKGPQGMGPQGRRMGPCRNITPATAGTEEEKKTEGAGNVASGESGQAAASFDFGIGRGGKPRGCGRGYCGSMHRR